MKKQMEISQHFLGDLPLLSHLHSQTFWYKYICCMSPILFFIFFFTCTGVGIIFLQINPAAVAFIDILTAAWERLKEQPHVA